MQHSQPVHKSGARSQWVGEGIEVAVGVAAVVVGAGRYASTLSNRCQAMVCVVGEVEVCDAGSLYLGGA